MKQRKDLLARYRAIANTIARKRERLSGIKQLLKDSRVANLPDLILFFEGYLYWLEEKYELAPSLLSV